MFTYNQCMPAHLIKITLTKLNFDNILGTDKSNMATVLLSPS